VLLVVINYIAFFPYVVTGEANFTMEMTSLIVGGFSQPAVARTLIEQSGSIETGLAQCFLWVFPKPSYAKFNELEAVDENFTTLIGECLNKSLVQFNNNRNCIHISEPSYQTMERKNTKTRSEDFHYW